MIKTARKTTPNEKTPLELAEANLRTLEQKRAKLVAKLDQVEREAQAISYKALAGGDKEATDKLDASNGLAIKLGIEIKNFDAAIVIARTKVQETKTCERVEAERLAATELLGLCKVLREAGQQADDALSVLNEAAVTMGDTVGAINRLGVGNPSAAQLQSLGERAILTALVDHPWARAFPHIASTDRRSFTSFLSAWASSLEQKVDAKLKQLNHTKEDGSTRAA